MIDKDVIIEKTNSIQNCLKRIHDTIKGNFDRLVDFDIQDIVVLNLQRAIQLTIDMASYVVGSEKLGPPNSLKDCFLILEKNQIIKHDISTKMQKMVGFRNIAIHDYQAIDPAILRSIITHHLKDIESFYDIVVKKYCL